MIEISIDLELKNKAPALTLGCISASVVVTEHDETLWREINARLPYLVASLSVEQIAELPPVQAQRNAYKAIGKDPRRYRGSAEALLRRVLQGKGLYAVNTLVDINNLLSLETYHPVGTYDQGHLQPPIRFRIGRSGETYPGIGDRPVNIERLPVFADQLGPFGSPTRDSERAAITSNTSRIMMIIVSFAGSAQMEQALERACLLLERYARASDVATAMVA